MVTVTVSPSIAPPFVVAVSIPVGAAPVSWPVIAIITVVAVIIPVSAVVCAAFADATSEGKASESDCSGNAERS